MNPKTFLWLAGCLLGLLSPAGGAGFIVIEQPLPVPGGRPLFAQLEVASHHVEVKIDGQVAVTSIDQEFFNPNDQRLEGTFMFPVPKDAHIDKFSMEVGGKMVEAELLPADKARQIYEDIVRRMRDPALLEFAGRDLFKVRIFPIEPHSRKPIRITYTELLAATSGAVTYTYPMSAGRFPAQPGRSLSMKVELKTDQPLASIYSPSHKVEIRREGANRAVIGYESKDAKGENDFQLVYGTTAQDIGLTLVTEKPDASDDGYFLLLAAPTVPKEAKPAPKDIVFVVDTSGSMAGAKLDQARKALGFCVENLNAEDHFEIIRFSTEAEPLFGKLVAADADDRRQAADFITGLKPMGGTAIADALTRALRLRPEKSERPFVVIFLTDGLPTVGTRDPEQIVADAKKASGVRIFSFGIGSDVNTQLLDQIAESTRGFSQYVLAEEDLEVKLSNFYTRIKEPALTNIRLDFAGSVRTSKIYPAALPDLFKGDQLVITGRYQGSGEVEARLTGLAAGREQTFTYKVRFEERKTGNAFVPRLWATRRVGFLLAAIRLHGETNELRDETSELARKYGIVTPYTAYLIVEDEARRDVPTAARSLRQMTADTAARGEVAKAWTGFKDKKEGEDGVANARSQNLFKYAEQAGSSIAAGAAESIRGMTRMAAPAAPAERDRIRQYAQQSKFVNGRAFFQNGNQWVDSTAQNISRREHVQFNSDAYFALLQRHPEAAPWLALGQNLLLALDNTVYEITD
ncbi:MAG: VIT and vWA domain-containing protein [Chthoniobacterales bacterium]